MAELPPLRTAHEWVRERLRADIVAGLYPPGASLKQTELAHQLGTSVTPVREAMRDLAADGLIQIDPQRVARVRSIDAAEATEINEIRLLLEPLAARRAAEHSTPDDLERIRAAALLPDAAADDTAWLLANHEFHLRIIECSRSPHLVGILTNLRQISTFHLGALVRTSQEIRRKSSSEHVALVEAVASGDGDGAARIMRSHLAPTHQLAGLDKADPEAV